MKSLEIPLGKRTKQYRFFEILPGLLSYGAIILLIVLSFLNTVLASAYLLLIVLTALVRAVGIAYHTIKGNKELKRACAVNWHARLMELGDAEASYKKLKDKNYKEYEFSNHKENLLAIATNPKKYPKPDEIINAVIITAYTEPFDVIEPTIKALTKVTYDKKNLLIFFAYEERGGEAIEATVKKLKSLYGDQFMDFVLSKHPKDLPNEVVGKGGNITYAGHRLKEYCDRNKIAYDKVIVTTLDCDNRPHPKYFDAVAYEYIVNENRNNMSYQPVSLFINNIWDVPAPMRILATGNSFWNIISSVRPHTLRNFASHSQPLKALVGMNFWSVRTIVEDGHQYWRSYFYFKGNYTVQPILVPIYQDAVLSGTLKKTLKDQFKQLRRWSYGASDIAYVAMNIFTKDRDVPLMPDLGRFIRLLDGHVTLACISFLVAFGGWVPLIVNPRASMLIAAQQLPDAISKIQQVAMLGIIVTIVISFQIIPKRPARYKWTKSIFMFTQWILMPVTAILYSALAAYVAQTRLMFGKYLDKFDLTEKITVDSLDKLKAKKK
ncbi:hypothetical protein EUA76_01645 [TM7 phylum sp. oral taxon 350]|nr:hypothetical protein EUA76_01645 [TM7 phylum sp. oral taxon 350]